MDLATESVKIGIRQYSLLFSLFDGETEIKRTTPGDIEKWKCIPESVPPVQLLQIQWEIKLVCRPPFWPLITRQAPITIAALLWNWGAPRLPAWSLGVSFGSAYDIPRGAEILRTRVSVQFRLSHPWPISPSYYYWQNLPKNICPATMRQGVRESGSEFPEGEINLILWD